MKNASGLNRGLMAEARYLLDTSALFALFQEEPGAHEVEGILRESRAGKAKTLVSFVSFVEVFYRLIQTVGVERAQETYANMKMLPIEKVGSEEPLELEAGELKAKYRLSLADAFIAATARLHHAKLVHKDPELEALATAVSLMPLPYKQKKIQHPI